MASHSRFWAVAATLAWFFLSASVSHADFKLDRSFGGDGVVEIESLEPMVTIDRYGRILVTDRGYAVMTRLKRDGSPDRFGRPNCSYDDPECEFGHMEFYPYKLTSSPVSTVEPALRNGVSPIVGTQIYSAAPRDPRIRNNGKLYTVSALTARGYIDKGVFREGVYAAPFSTKEGDRWVSAVLPSSAGSTLVSGALWSFQGQGTDEARVLKIDSRGEPVESFGNDGYKLLRLPGLPPRQGDIALDLVHGKNGTSLALAIVHEKLALFGLRPNGRPDPDFGNRGVVRLSRKTRYLIPGTTDTETNNLATGSGGKIAVLSARGEDFFGKLLWQVTPRGVLDRSFGHGGAVNLGKVLGAHNPEDSFLGYDVVADRAGWIVVGSDVSGVDGKAQMFRLTHKGRLDRSFGQNGTITFPDVSQLTSIARTKTKLIVSGLTRAPSNRPEDAKIYRLTQTGQ